MSYSMKVVRSTAQHTTNWSGGTTTQIAIYPRNAEYNKHNFTWRLSVAQVDGEESTFTSLPGISRVLMVVDGAITLTHQGHHSVTLQPFEQDRFDGDWTTKSVGKVRDFNLMMSQNCSGKLTAISCREKESIEVSDLISRDCEPCTSAFYCVDGSIQVLVDEKKTYELQQGDMLILTKEHYNEKITLKIRNLEEKNVHVIRADMQY